MCYKCLLYSFTSASSGRDPATFVSSTNSFNKNLLLAIPNRALAGWKRERQKNGDSGRSQRQCSSSFKEQRETLGCSLAIQGSLEYSIGNSTKIASLLSHCLGIPKYNKWVRATKFTLTGSMGLGPTVLFRLGSNSLY